MNKTIEYFKILSSIPRESKNESAVANYLVEFAKENNLWHYKDKFNNVLIKKINLNKKPIILQAHTDMVCVAEPNYNFNFAKEPLKLLENNGYLFADKTSLGADNGIGVAIILSLLAEDNNYNIEAFFTTDEEVTMTGALNFDYSLLLSNKLISLDGFSSNQLINGCASICDSDISFNPKFVEQIEDGFKLTISGLKGGHSGEDINKNTGNAIEIITNILLKLKDVSLSSMQGGKQYNFIPNMAFATFVCKNNLNEINNIVKELNINYNGININLESVKVSSALNKEDSLKLLKVLNNIKTGVISFSGNGDIELSQNLASINLIQGLIKINLRATNCKKENEQILFLKNLAVNSKFNFSIFDKQEGLSPNKNSSLTKDLCRINECVNNESFKVLTKNISLEGAIFKHNKKDLDVVIVSPDIYDVHSTKERVYVPSIDKTYKLLQNFLAEQ